MAGIEVRIGDASYPCRMTMGAMLRFKRITGHEVSEMPEGSVSEMAVLLYCCTASASNADGVRFEMDCDTFCDRIDPESMDAMAAAIQEGAAEGDGGQKKRD